MTAKALAYGLLVDLEDREVPPVLPVGLTWMVLLVLGANFSLVALMLLLLVLPVRRWLTGGSVLFL